MTGIKASDHGIVVDHKESNVRFAISDKNYDEKVHRKVRDLLPGESVRSYQPKRLSESSEGVSTPQSGTGTPEQGSKPSPSSSDALNDGSHKANKPEGAAPAASQEKEGK